MEASGSDGNGEFAGNTEFFDQSGECLAEVRECGFLGIALAVGAQAGTQLRMCTPHAILVALHDDRHSYRARFGHVVTIARFGGRASERFQHGSAAP